MNKTLAYLVVAEAAIIFVLIARIIAIPNKPLTPESIVESLVLAGIAIIIGLVIGLTKKSK